VITPEGLMPGAPKPKRRTKAEIANDRIIAEQMEIAEGAKRAGAMAQAAKAEWERHRPREPVGMDYSRFIY
jgi:hypothetical protein